MMSVDPATTLRALIRLLGDHDGYADERQPRSFSRIPTTQFWYGGEVRT
jgi:hypothetical protein